LLATESVEHGARGLFYEISAMGARVCGLLVEKFLKLIWRG
jgi:hypothetical protein